MTQVLNETVFDHIPQSRKASILFTTRTRKAAVDQAGSNIIELGGFSDGEATESVKKQLLRQQQEEDNKCIRDQRR